MITPFDPMVACHFNCQTIQKPVNHHQSSENQYYKRTSNSHREGRKIEEGKEDIVAAGALKRYRPSTKVEECWKSE